MNLLSENDSRFPYTYSADWVRMCGLAESRSDAALWAKNHAEKRGIDVEKVKRDSARMYIQYHNAISVANDMIVEWKSKND